MNAISDPSGSVSSISVLLLRARAAFHAHRGRAPPLKKAQLGEAATDKLRVLLNSGTVSMTSIDRDRDVYGRLLRNVAVDGADVGEAMIGAGVAREYGSGKRSWC